VVPSRCAPFYGAGVLDGRGAAAAAAVVVELGADQAFVRPRGGRMNPDPTIAREALCRRQANEVKRAAPCSLVGLGK
jgi:hypothetical protein